jgi:hypothetical protein
LTCRACGAAQEKKVKRAFGRLTDDPVRGEYRRERRTDYLKRVAQGIAWIIIFAAQLVFALLLIAYIKRD